MLTKKEKALVDYWHSWRPGRKDFVPNNFEEEPAKVEVVVEVDRLKYLAEDIVDGIQDII